MNITIRTEEDAWHWLQQALDGHLPEDEPLRIKFDGWPSLDLKFRGQDFDQSVPTRIMPPLLDAQKEIHRIHSSLTYGTTSLRKLREEDRVDLELNVKVKKGSSEYETNLSETLTKIAESALDKMESTHVLIAVLVAAVTWGTNVAWKNWLAFREKEINARLSAEKDSREQQTRVHLSKEETARMKLLSDAYARVPVSRSYTEGADEFRNDSLRKLKDSDHFTVPNSNFEIDGRTASSLTVKPREQSIEDRIDDDFIIQSVTSGETEGYRLKVKCVSDGTIISVAIPDGTLSSDEREILKQNEWAKLPVRMELNVRILRGEITAARLVKASKIEREAKG